jgi:uncharacterized protein YaiL (DUF2058 family)
MSLSLKDQLIAAGLVKRDAAKPKPAPRPAKYQAPAAKAPPKPVEPSLAELYRARDQAAQKELQEAQRLNVEKALAKRARKNQALELITGKALNTNEGEQVVRHFEYARKIRRIYLTSEQRTQLNAGELGIVQLDGHFSLLPHAIVAAVHAVAPEFIALMGASAEAVLPVEDPAYSDPKHQIPDDLTW